MSGLASAETLDTRFQTIGMGDVLDWPRIDRDRARHAELAATLERLPPGRRSIWGIPFEFAPSAGGACAAWAVLRRGRSASISLDTAELSGRQPSYVLFVHVCDRASDEVDIGSVADEQLIPESTTMLGRTVAEYVLVYADASEHRQPVRWRFEVSGGTPMWGQRPFVARPIEMDEALDMRSPGPGEDWGYRQTGVRVAAGGIYVYALVNPHPERDLRSLRVEARPDATIAIAAATSFYGRSHPLRHGPLRTLKVSAIRSMAQELSVDMGIIAGRRFAAISQAAAVPREDASGWQACGDPASEAGPHDGADLFIDLTAADDAVLACGTSTVALHDLYRRGSASLSDGAVQIEVVAADTRWVSVAIEDSGSGRPVPARVRFQDSHGLYLPPYGHRRDVNDGWFQDYGADLKLNGLEYAYVDGTFRIELPLGEVAIEAFRGFEHEVLRSHLRVGPGTEDLVLRPERRSDWRAEGWYAADTHVHFLSPQTAWLEARAEGLDLINLLATQWGDLYTNVGDLTGAISGVSRDDTLVYVGTENRHHMLGHVAMLGVKGHPVMPLASGGPDESHLGDVSAATIAQWSDDARTRDGIVIVPHFPNPYCEVAADIVLGKVDAVELNMRWWELQLREWYRYLGCGYRVAAVGGTDKMAANIPVGGIRTYALVGTDGPFSYDAWADAVRVGRTFATTGPLLDLRVEGRRPGDGIDIPDDGATLHARVFCESVVQFELVELVVNGRPVAARAARAGELSLTFEEPIKLTGSAWIAARCSGRRGGWSGSPRMVAAHTSPIYVTSPRGRLFDPDDASFMSTLLDGGLAWLDTLAISASDERQAAARAVLASAQDALRTRSAEHARRHHA